MLSEDLIISGKLWLAREQTRETFGAFIDNFFGVSSAMIITGARLSATSTFSCKIYVIRTLLVCDSLVCLIDGKQISNTKGKQCGLDMNSRFFGGSIV